MTLTTIALAATLTVAAPDSGLSARESVFLLAVGSDMTSTLLAGRDGYNVPDWYGWQEDNPLADYLLSRDRSNGLFVAGTVAYSVGTVYLTRRLSKTHPKTAKAILVGLTCIHTYLAAKNTAGYMRLRIQYGKVHP